MTAGFLKLNRLSELAHFAINARAHITPPAQVFDYFGMFTFLAANHGCQDHEPSALRPLAHLVDYLVHRLLGDGDVTVRAERPTHPRKEQAQIIVNLGHGADCGPRVATGGLLIYGNSWRQPLNAVHIGFIHLPKKLASVGGERLDIAALPLGIDGIESEGGLARTAESGDNDQLIARDVDIDILEIVLSGPPDRDIFLHRANSSTYFARKIISYALKKANIYS